MTVQVPSNIYSAVHPVAQAQNVPDAIWESVVYQESSFNPKAVGDQGTSFGLFQLHMGGQLPVQYNSNPTPVFDPSLNAQIGMPAVGGTWNKLKGSFDPNNFSWWQQFAILSGHPGGSIGDPATSSEASALMNDYKLFSSGQQPTLQSASVGTPLSANASCEMVDCSSGLCNTPIIGGALCPCCVGTSQGQSSTSGTDTNSWISQAGLILFGAVIIIIAVAAMIKPKNVSLIG